MIGAIDSGSTNGHRLCITNDGARLYTDNEEDATVSVIDNGIGLPKDSAIFEMFTRGGGEHEGSGIGLATCRRIHASVPSARPATPS